MSRRAASVPRQVRPRATGRVTGAGDGRCGSPGERDDGERALVVALCAMLTALPLLDRAGCEFAAVRLQHLIDSVDERVVGDPGGWPPIARNAQASVADGEARLPIWACHLGSAVRVTPLSPWHDVDVALNRTDGSAEFGAALQLLAVAPDIGVDGTGRRTIRVQVIATNRRLAMSERRWSGRRYRCPSKPSGWSGPATCVPSSCVMRDGQSRVGAASASCGARLRRVGNTGPRTVMRPAA